MKKLAFILLAALLLVGCSKKSPTTVPTIKSGFVIAEVLHTGWGQCSQMADIYSDPVAAASQCSAYIRWGYRTYPLTERLQLPTGVRLSGTAQLPTPVTDCSLYVVTNLGYSRGGGVNMPGSYSYISPAPYDTLPWGNVGVFWTRSAYATWYEIELYYTADSASRYLGTVDSVFFLSDTSLILPQAFFKRYPGTTWAAVTCYLYAHGGNLPGPGARGNMSGDFGGFFYSTYAHPGYYTLRFFIGTPRPAAEPPVPTRMTEERRRKMLLRALGVS
jgi:hypothetical protein